MALSPDTSPLGLLRAAAGRTREQGSASLIVEFTGFELPGAGETVRETGHIDFSVGLTELGCELQASEEFYFRRGRQLRGPAERPVGPLVAGSPLWLIEVTQGVITARSEGTTWHRDVHVGCYRAVIDLVAASDSSPYALASPGGFSLSELRRIPGNIMLDTQGRLRVIDVELAGLKATLTLEGFGHAAFVNPVQWPDRVTLPPNL